MLGTIEDPNPYPNRMLSVQNLARMTEFVHSEESSAAGTEVENWRGCVGRRRRFVLGGAAVAELDGEMGWTRARSLVK